MKYFALFLAVFAMVGYNLPGDRGDTLISCKACGIFHDHAVNDCDKQDSFAAASASDITEKVESGESSIHDTLALAGEEMVVSDKQNGYANINDPSMHDTIIHDPIIHDPLAILEHDSEPEYRLGETDIHDTFAAVGNIESDGFDRNTGITEDNITEKFAALDSETCHFNGNGCLNLDTAEI